MMHHFCYYSNAFDCAHLHLKDVADSNMKYKRNNMKKLSLELLAEAVTSSRKANKITQAQLAKAAGMNRSILSRLESADYMPSVDQLMALSQILGFDPMVLFEDDSSASETQAPVSYNIAVAGTGYVGLSLAVLLAQHNHVIAVDIVQDKVDKLNNYISPIRDEYIEKYLAAAKTGDRALDLTATTDGRSAYSEADFIIIAAPTNYDPQKNFFDCSAVESVISLVLESTADREIKR